MDNQQRRYQGNIVEYFKNKKFFEIWTEKMSYILGFISADGCITDRNEFIIGIHENDIEILEYIKKSMDLENPIHYRAYNNRKMVEIRFISSKICDDLKILNITPRKTYTLRTPPFIPDNMITHYIRGIFDGDGSISLSNRHSQLTAEASIVSASEIFILQIHRLLLSKKVYCNISEHRSNQEGHVILYRLRFGGKNVATLGEFMYKDCEFYLQRKFDKFKTFSGKRFVKCLCCKKVFFKEVFTQDFCKECHDLVINHNTKKLQEIIGIRSETIRNAGINGFKKLLVDSRR